MSLSLRSEATLFEFEGALLEASEVQRSVFFFI